MLLVDVNVLVYAHRVDALGHIDYLRWVQGMMDADEAYGIADIVLSGLVRVVTHPRIFHPPSSTNEALAFANELRGQPNCVRIEPGRRHWEIFTRLCRTVGARGSLVPDAYLAALAMESGSEWITADRDYSRFPGLRWRHPLVNLM